MVDIDARVGMREAAEVARLPVFKVVSVTFRVIARAWVPLYAMALVVIALGVPLNLLFPKITVAFQSAQLAKTSPVFPPYIFAEVGGVLLVQTLVSLFVFGAMQYLALRIIAGESASGTLKVALVRFIPMSMSSLVFYVMMSIGFLGIIVPGIIIGAIYGLAPTACVVERRGAFASLSRSAELTRSNRLRCIAATILLTVVPTLVAIALNTLMERLGGYVGALVFSLAGSFLTLPILYVFPAVLLRELRLIKEGGARAGVTAVF